LGSCRSSQVSLSSSVESSNTGLRCGVCSYTAV
jgi:hypothetical protein